MRKGKRGLRLKGPSSFKFATPERLVWQIDERGVPRQVPAAPWPARVTLKERMQDAR